MLISPFLFTTIVANAKILLDIAELDQACETGGPIAYPMWPVVTFNDDKSNKIWLNFYTI